MNSWTFVAIRQRRDGSVYFQKKPTIWSTLRETVAIVLLVVIVPFILALAIFQSPPTLAQQQYRPTAESAMTQAGFRVSGDKTVRIELDSVANEEKLARPTNVPSLWPVSGRLTSGFGGRRNPFRRRSSELHPGQDIAAPIGTQVRVTADGTVVFAGWKKGYGQVVIVDHGQNISTRYGHLSLIETNAGTAIKRGEEIGLVGSTGHSTGPHLHYEVRVDDVAINPMAFLPPARTMAFAIRHSRVTGL